MTAKSLLESALDLAARGFPVFPLRVRGKKPLTEHGFKDATTDPTQIRAWWTKWPDANIGMPTGAVSGIDVLDVDAKTGGRKTIADLEAEHGSADSLTVETGGGGLHLWYTHVEGVRNRAGMLPGLDVRGDGGYVVVPPSIHPNGTAYRWLHGIGPDFAPVAPWPAWLLKIVLPAPRLASTAPAPQPSEGGSTPYGLKALKGMAAELGGAKPGTRDELRNRLSFRAGRLAAGGHVTEGDAEEALASACDANGLIAEEGEEKIRERICAGIAAGVAAGPKGPRVGAATATQPGPGRPTNFANSAPQKVKDARFPPPNQGGLCRRRQRMRTPFPALALPPTVRRYVEEGAKTVGCCLSMIALPLLISMAAAIGNTRRLRIKGGARPWNEPAVLWGVLVGESGTLKSPAIDLAVEPSRRREARAAKENEEALRTYEREVAQYRKDLSLWMRAKGDRPAPEPPVRPALRRFIVSDTTIEALADRLLDNPRGLLLVRDELGAWLRSFDQYRAGGRGGDVAKWLEVHGARLLIVDRKTGEPKTIHIPRAAVSILGGIQPGTLRHVLTAEFFENGLAARLLLTMPPTPRRRWSEAEVSEEAAAGIDRTFEGLFDLKMETAANGEAHPGDLRLTPEAKALWVEFFNEHATEGEGLTGDLAAAWSKAEGYAARLSLVVHLARWAATDEPLALPDAVDAESLGAGITLARWFVGEAERVYAAQRESDADRVRRRLAEWIDNRGGRVTVRDVARGPRAFRGDEERAERALESLVKAGWGVWEDVPATLQGGQPTRVFVLDRNPHDGGDGDRTPSGAEDEKCGSGAAEPPEGANSSDAPQEVVSPSPGASPPSDGPVEQAGTGVDGAAEPDEEVAESDGAGEELP